jgi:hypothetical protein
MQRSPDLEAKSTRLRADHRDLLPVTVAALISGLLLVLFLLLHERQTTGEGGPLPVAPPLALRLVKAPAALASMRSQGLHCEDHRFGFEVETRCAGGAGQDPTMIVFLRRGENSLVRSVAASVAFRPGVGPEADSHAAAFFKSLLDPDMAAEAAFVAAWIDASIGGGSLFHEGAMYIIVATEEMRLLQMTAVR